DDASASAGPDRQAHNTVGATPGPESPFADCGEIAPVFDDDGHLKMLTKPGSQRHVAPSEPERQHNFALRLPDNRRYTNADAANGLVGRAGSGHQPADQADQLFEIAFAIIIGRLVHFCLHDAFEISHGAVELALAGLDADDRMR